MKTNETEQKRHVAEVTLLGSYDLGKNTDKKAGIKIRIFDRGGTPQLGTIKIGQGSFEWWSKKAKKYTRRFTWHEFAVRMGDK
jgi:hypothetical protein